MHRASFEWVLDVPYWRTDELLAIALMLLIVAAVGWFVKIRRRA